MPRPQFPYWLLLLHFLGKLFLLKCNIRVKKCTKPKCAPYLNSMHFQSDHTWETSWEARLPAQGAPGVPVSHSLISLKGGTYLDGF